MGDIHPIACQHFSIKLTLHGDAESIQYRAESEALSSSPGRGSHPHTDENNQNSDSNEGIENQAEAICLLGAEVDFQICLVESDVHLIEVEAEAEVLDVD